MTDSANDLPNDIERLKAMLIAERATHAAERARLVEQNDRLLHTLRQLQRNQFGRKSERLSEDQLNLGLEDLETAIASGEAAQEKADATLAASRKRARKANRGHLPAHLPREEVVIEPESKVCPCCGGALHAIGEDRSERLDKVPARLKVIVTRRPKYACRTCEKTGADETAGVIQAPAPARLIEGGLPPWMRNVALVGIGALIGTRFARMRMKTLLTHVNAGLGSFAVAIVVSAVFVTVIVLTTNVHFADIVVAFAPGAMDAMLALALTLHIDPIFVGAHHLSRFVFVSIATPGIVHLFGRPQEDVDD